MSKITFLLVDPLQLTMTEQQHPITPPPELFKQWEDDILNERDNVDHVLDCAWKDGFRAGADQELEACCEWFRVKGYHPEVYRDLRAARRPPPSLAEEALALIGRIQGNRKSWQLDELDVVRAALERLQELENND